MAGEDYNKISVVAIVGTLLAWFLYSSTLSTVNQRRKLLEQGLGPMNPYLDLYSVSSNTVWLIYGLMISNWYVIVNRIVGITLYIYYTVTGIMLMGVYWGKCQVVFANASPDSPQKQAMDHQLRLMKRAQYIFVSILLAWVIIWIILITWLGYDGDLIGTIAGYHSNGYYLVRTPHLYYIARTKNVGSVILLNVICDFSCCFCWFNYGLAIKNTAFIYPNGVGLVYTSLYLIFYFLYRNNKVHDPLAVTASAEAEDESKEAISEEGIELVDKTSNTLNNLELGSHEVLSLKLPSSDESLQSDSDNGANDSNRSENVSRVAQAYAPRLVTRVRSLSQLLGKDSPKMVAGGGIVDVNKSRLDIDLQMGQSTSTKAVSGDFTLASTSATGTQESPRILRDAVKALDSSMEYLVNIGRSRANSLFIDPAAAESTLLQETLLYRAIDLPTLTSAVCAECSQRLVSSAKYCWGCGTVVPRMARSYSNVQGEYTELFSQNEPPLPQLAESSHEDRDSMMQPPLLNSVISLSTRENSSTNIAQGSVSSQQDPPLRSISSQPEMTSTETQTGLVHRQRSASNTNM